MLYKYIGLYTRLTCVHVEPAHQTHSTAPPLPCESHPAQRFSIIRYFIFLSLGVSSDALDRISFRVGYIITTNIIALIFVRVLFLGIVFSMGAWVWTLTLVLLFGLRYFLALRQAGRIFCVCVAI